MTLLAFYFNFPNNLCCYFPFREQKERRIHGGALNPQISLSSLVISTRILEGFLVVTF